MISGGWRRGIGGVQDVGTASQDSAEEEGEKGKLGCYGSPVALFCECDWDCG